MLIGTAITAIGKTTSETAACLGNSPVGGTGRDSFFTYVKRVFACQIVGFTFFVSMNRFSGIRDDFPSGG